MAEFAAPAAVFALGAAAADLVASTVQALLDTLHQAYNAVYNFIARMLGNPLFFVLLVLLIVFVAFWIPFHQVFLQVGQAVHTDVIRPVVRDALIPVADAVAPAYEKVAAWWNFGNFLLFKNLPFDLITIPLRCQHLPEFVRAVFRDLVPLGRSAAVVARIAADSLITRETPPERPQIAVGLAFNAIADIVDKATDVVGCYCSFAAYYLDFVTLFFTNAHVQCVASNVIGLWAEVVRQTIVTILEVLKWIGDVVQWLFCKVFRPVGCDLAFPAPDAHVLLPDLDVVLDRVGAGLCCGTEVFDDFANTALDTAVDIFNTVEPFPGLGNLTEPDFVKFAAPVKAVAPMVIESFRMNYEIVRGFVDGSFDFGRVNFTRTEAAATQMCTGLAEGWASWGPRLGHVVAYYQTGGMPQALIYGPRFLGHVCQAAVSLEFGVLDVISEVRSYQMYQEGHYFDCALQEMRLAAVEGAADTVAFLNVIPAWRSCVVYPTQYDNETGMPLAFGFPRIKCADSAFHEEIGQTLTFPFKLISVAADYVATLTENLDNGTALRMVSSGCIFDELDNQAESYARVWAVALDQIPNSVVDVNAVANVTGNLTAEVLRWLLPGLAPFFGHDPTEDAVDFVENLVQTIKRLLEWVPFSNVTVEEPFVGTTPPRFTADRPYGIFDWIPTIVMPIPAGPVTIPYPVATVRSLPALYAKFMHFTVEFARFIADFVHTGDFEHWRWPIQNYERLLRAEAEFVDELAYSASSVLCNFKAAASGGEYTEQPNCTLFVNVSVIDFTMCPLNLLICPERPLKDVGRAVAHFLDLAPQLLLYPADFAEQLLDPALCDLENASVALEETFAEWNISLGVPYWGTHLSLDVPWFLGSTVFASTKLIALANTIVVETLQSMMHKHYYAHALCTEDHPSYNSTSHQCTRCTAAYDPDARCPEGTVCCIRSGKCADRCFDGDGIMDSVTDFTAAVRNLVQAVTEPLAVIDPKASEFADALGKIPLQTINAVFKFLLAPTRVPAGQMHTILPEFTCAIDSAAEAIGRLATLSLAVGGRFLTMMIEFSGDVNASSTAKANIDVLGTATVDVFKTVGRVVAEMFGTVLGVVGTALDSGEMSTFADWIATASEGLCRVSDAMQDVPDAIASFIRAWDITGNDLFCELSLLAGSLMRLVAELVAQVVNLIGTSTTMDGGPGTPYLGRGFDLGKIVDAVRDVVVELGNIFSFLLYSVLSALIPVGAPREDLWEMCDTLGLVFSAILNMAVCLFECVANVLAQIMSAWGFDTALCGSSTDPFEIVAPMLRGIILLLQAVADLVDLLIPGLGEILRFVASLIQMFLDPESWLHELVMAVFDVLFSAIRFIVALVTWEDVGDAAIELAMSIVNLFMTIIEIVFMIIDCVLFGCHKVLECIFHFWDCITNPADYRTVGAFATREDGTVAYDAARPVSSWLGLYSYVFGANDSCRYDFKAVAKMHYGYEQDPAAAMMTESDGGPPVSLLLRLRVLACMERGDMLWQQTSNATNASSSAPAPELRTSAPPADAKCERDSDAVCKLAAAERLAGGIQSTLSSMTEFALPSNATIHERTAVVKQAQLLSQLFSRLTSFGSEAWAAGSIKHKGETVSAAFGRFVARSVGAPAERHQQQQQADLQRVDVEELARYFAEKTHPTLPRQQGSYGWMERDELVKHQARYDPADLEKDTCNHTIRDAFGLLQEPLPPLCSSTCPNCSDPDKQLHVPAICPVSSCPDMVQRFPEVQGICTRICPSAYHTDEFWILCHTSYWTTFGLTDWSEVFMANKLETVKDRILFIDGPEDEETGGPGANISSLTDEDLNWIEDEDKLPGSDGPLKRGDVCTDVGRYGNPTATYCNNKCSANDPTSLLWKTRYTNFSGLSPSGIALLERTCASFCTTYDATCSTPVRDVHCSESGLSAATCYQRCFLEGGAIGAPLPALLSVETCSSTTLRCTFPEPGEENLYRTCECPARWLGLHDNRTNTTCMCEYAAEPVDITELFTKQTRILFACPYTFRDPMYQWLTDFDMEAVSATLRPMRAAYYTDTIERTFYTKTQIENWLDYNGEYNYPWNNGKMFNGTYYDPLHDYPSDNAITFSMQGVICENETETVTLPPLCGDDWVCDLPPTECHLVEECVVVEVPQTVANVVAQPGANGLDDRAVSWTYPFAMTLSHPTCINASADGLCNDTVCDPAATYRAPSPVTCIPGRHCAFGSWCPLNGYCIVEGLATFTGTYHDNYAVPQHRVDVAADAPFNVSVCRNVTHCTGPDWQANVSAVASNVTEECTQEMVDNTGYRGMDGDVAIWSLLNITIPGCLHVVGSCGVVQICADIRICYGVAGCQSTASSCAFCDMNPLAPECASCEIRVGCVNVTVCPLPTDTSSSEFYEDHFVNYTISTTGGTNGSCHASAACGQNVTVTRQNATCHAVTEYAAGYDPPIHVLFDPVYEPGPGDYPRIDFDVDHPITFTGDEQTCSDPYVHQGDVCSYLCADDVDGHETDCVDLFNNTLRCWWYKDPVNVPPDSSYAVWAARRWFCEQLPYYTKITTADFPIASGYGIISDPGRVGSYAWGTDARSCPDGGDYACIMLAPGANLTSTVDRLTESECQVLEKYLTGTFLKVDEGTGWTRLKSLERLYYNEFGTQPWASVRHPSTYAWKVQPPLVPRSAPPADPALLVEVDAIRREAGSICAAEWFAALRNRFGEDSDEMLVGRAMVMAGLVGRDIDKCVDAEEECPARDCNVSSLYPEVCTRYEIPQGDDPSCVPREYVCTLYAEDPCTAFYANYTGYSEDPTADYEAMVAEEEEVPAPPARDTAFGNAWKFKQMISDFADGRREARRTRGPTEESAWTAMSNQFVRSLEAATCASLPHSAACRRLNGAVVAARRTATYYDAYHVGRAAAEWLPPVNSTDRTCYMMCGYDWTDLARRSCLAQADKDGRVTRFFEAVQDALRDICDAAEIGNGTDFMLDWAAIIPHLDRIKLPPLASSGGSVASGQVGVVVVTQQQTWGADSVVIAKFRLLLSRLAARYLGLNVSPTLAPDEVALSTMAAVLGFDDSDAFVNASYAWFTNFNLNPDDGDVGFAYWTLLLSPFGNKCAAINGTYRIWGIPIFSPLWIPYLPTWLGNFTLDVLHRIADREWIVPDSMVLDPDECYFDQELCIPFTDGCPCSPRFEKCSDRLGFSSPLDAVYFLLNWIYPSAASSRFTRLFARFTMTTSYLSEFANVTQKEDFNDYVFCFFVAGLSSAIWLAFLVPVGVLLGVLLFRLALAGFKFIAISTGIFFFLLLIVPVEYAVELLGRQ